MAASLAAEEALKGASDERSSPGYSRERERQDVCLDLLSTSTFGSCPVGDDFELAHFGSFFVLNEKDVVRTEDSAIDAFVSAEGRSSRQVGRTLLVTFQLGHDQIDHLVGGLVSVLLWRTPIADLGDRILDGELSRGPVLYLNPMFLDVVGVHDFGEQVNALLAFTYRQRLQIGGHDADVRVHGLRRACLCRVPSAGTERQANQPKQGSRDRCLHRGRSMPRGLIQRRDNSQLDRRTCVRVEHTFP
jgi:hypothetical protein